MRTQIVTATKLRSRLFRVVKELDKFPIQYIVTHNGEPVAVLMSYEEHQSLLATIDVMSDPEMVKNIREGISDKKHGRVHSFEDVFGEPL